MRMPIVEPFLPLPCRGSCHAKPCTLHLGPDIHRLLPASPISRLAFYIPIKLNELVQVIQKILSSGCPVVAWWKIISPPINLFTFMFLMITISMIIMATMMKCFHLYRIYRLQRLGQWPLFLIVLDAGTLNQGSCHLGKTHIGGAISFLI